ncbi:hypothetical protein QJQ45_025499 [Haematococcus lacustris]|nr:hypothetical protein QJQ45_025499 [Haematococcus lacustris]
MKQAHQLVDQLALWEVLGTTQHPNQVRVTGSQLRSMVRGEPAPWERESQTSHEGKVLFFGRQFFHLLSDSQRCLEQLALLKLERAQLNAWLHFILRASRAAYAAAQAGEGAQAGGRQFYLQQHITHYEGMLAKLQKLLVKPHLNRSSSIARSQPDKQVDLDAFATRIELANTKLLADFRADMSKELADFRVDMSKELADFRAGMSKELGDFKASTSKEMAEYKVSFEKSLYELKMDVKLEIQQLKLISLFAVAAVVLLAGSDSILGTDMSPLVKCMTHAHRTDAMQIILGGIAFDKQANMVDFLIGKHADMLKRKEDAAAQYKAQHQRTKTIAANADWPAQAFRYMSGQVLLVDTCSDSLPMPTPEMADLLTNGKKVTQLGAMEEKVQMLGMTHRVNNLSGSWCSPDVAGSVHTLGLAKLKAAKMARQGHQSQAKMKQAHQLVDQLALWEVLGTTQHPNQVCVTGSQLRSMVRGEPAPWERESQTSHEGKVLFFGRQFFHLLSDSQRCLEQLALLKLERARLNAWLHFILRASRAAYAAAQAGEGAQAGGRQFYLQQHITHYEGMLAKLQKLLWA